MDRKTQTQNEKPASRRGFFTSVGLGATAAAVSLIAAPKEAEAFTPTPAKGGAHYTESEHIKQYYRVNRY
jgi:hypothetical protein